MVERKRVTVIVPFSSKYGSNLKIKNNTKNDEVVDMSLWIQIGEKEKHKIKDIRLMPEGYDEEKLIYNKALRLFKPRYMIDTDDGTLELSGQITIFACDDKGEEIDKTEITIR